MKLTKEQRKRHDEAWERLQSDSLSDDDRQFVCRHLRPEATTDIGRNSAFFTPWEIASDFQIETFTHHSTERTRILDLCAGFGVLSLQTYLDSQVKPDVTCVELNPEFVAIGKKVFPEARWICGSVFDVPEILAGEAFTEFFSNPPFGRIPKVDGRKPHNAARFEFAVAEIGLSMAEFGTMICPRGATDWEFSGRPTFRRMDNPQYRKWSDWAGIRLSPNCGIDTCDSGARFSDTSIVVDIANVERV